MDGLSLHCNGPGCLSVTVPLPPTVDASMPLVFMPLTITSSPVSHLHRHPVLVNTPCTYICLCSLPSLAVPLPCGLVGESSLHFTISRLAATGSPVQGHRLVELSRWTNLPHQSTVAIPQHARPSKIAHEM